MDMFDSKEISLMRIYPQIAKSVENRFCKTCVTNFQISRIPAEITKSTNKI